MISNPLGEYDVLKHRHYEGRDTTYRCWYHVGASHKTFHIDVTEHSEYTARARAIRQAAKIQKVDQKQITFIALAVLKG